MADALFDFLAEQLDARSSLDRLEARGTLRLALKGAGLEPRTSSLEQLRVICQRVLPDELASRGVADPDAVCRGLIQDLASDAAPAASGAANSVESVFSRLGGD
jgi:hypothetical protein